MVVVTVYTVGTVLYPITNTHLYYHLLETVDTFVDTRDPLYAFSWTSVLLSTEFLPT